MYTIRQCENGWEVLAADGTRLGDAHATYDLALAAIAVELGQLAQLAAVDGTADGGEDGLLPEVWTSVEGICFSEPTGDGRDFSNCAWTWRDPAVSTLPLMLQTETEYGHFGAELAGFFTEVSGTDTPAATGRFYDSDAGRQLRDMLLGGRTFGVSVDPGAVEVEFRCTEYESDDWGDWCVDGITDFLAYEIIGMTATPFPAFARASIGLVGAATAVDSGTPAAVAASGAGTIDLTAPPAAWFQAPTFDAPTPLTITADGQVYGHVAAWGTCHISNPEGAGVCTTPPHSHISYRNFQVGEVLCDDGTPVATGALTWGAEHAPLNLNLPQARDYYAHSAYGWADVATGEDDHGVWVAGAIRPTVSAADLRVLRALAASGDWRYDPATRNLELCAVLAVNVPGFPIPRVPMLAASGEPTALTVGELIVAEPEPAAHLQSLAASGRVQTALVAANIVHPKRSAAVEADCGCGGHALRRGTLRADRTDAAFRSEVLRRLGALQALTEHLATPAAADQLARIRAAATPPEQ